MSDSDEYNSAKDEDVNPLADADDNSSDEEPLKKKSRGRPKSVAKAKTTPKKVVKSKKGKKTPQKATPIATKKGKRVKVELIPAEEDSESEEEEYEVSTHGTVNHEWKRQLITAYSLFVRLNRSSVIVSTTESINTRFGGRTTKPFTIHGKTITRSAAQICLKSSISK